MQHMGGLISTASCTVQRYATWSSAVASTGWLAALSHEREFYSALQCRVTHRTVVQWLVQACWLVGAVICREREQAEQTLP